MRLALIHRAIGAGPTPVESTAWRTCLREIHFLPDHRVGLEAGALTGAEAYALLLEVVCGLRSPLIGETEVQAQFKQFLTSEVTAETRWIRRLGQRVLGDAKRIRHKHLQGFGAHSYGRLTARYLVGPRVAIVGTGALASQVIESAPADATVEVWGRSAGRKLPARPTGLNFQLIASARRLAGSRREPTTLVIASPIGSKDLGPIVSCYASLTNAIDFRSQDHQTDLGVDVPVLLLADILSDDVTSDFGGAPRFRAAKADIRHLAQTFADQTMSRPLGWNDVCA